MTEVTPAPATRASSRRQRWLAVGLAGLVLLAGMALLSRWAAGGLMYDLEPGRLGFTTMHVTGAFRVDVPGSWRIDDTAAAFSGGSSIAVLGTLPLEARCGAAPASINCVFEQALEPGTLRVFLGGGSYRGGSILDEVDLGPTAGTVERTTIALAPAVRIERFADAAGYYHEDRNVTWRIANPRSLSNTYDLELMARDPDAGAAVAALDALVASLRFDEPPVRLPAGDAAGPASIAAARAFFSASDAALARGYGSVDVPDVTYYDCFAGDPGETTDGEIDIGPGGRLGGSVPVRCTWTIEPEGPAMWLLELVVEWSGDVGVAAYEETHWLNAAGESLHQVSSGDSPAYAPG